ncbi:MAG: CpaD family pilus assembly protein [Alphaproteobacteria bacterium]|nr:CpaD family pilus assembly protein [Alphaproteobacteria bacterium]
MKFIKYNALLFTALLSGCAPEIVDWTPAESPKENKVERTTLYHKIHYFSKDNAFSEMERNSLARFLKANAEPPSSVSVILEENDGHSKKRIKDIQRELVKHGIAYDMITVEPTERGLKSTTSSSSGVNLVLEKYLVIPPSCADFSQPIGDARQAQAPSNFGCATVANLGMMVANPRDLIRGRSLGASDGTVIAAGVDRYRKDNIKELLNTSTNVSPSEGVSSGGGGTSSNSSSGTGSY